MKRAKVMAVKEFLTMLTQIILSSDSAGKTEYLHDNS
jgi:hypothetical protein